MEDGKGSGDHKNAASEGSPTPKIENRKPINPTKPDRPKNKPTTRKKNSLDRWKRSWRASGPVRKLEVILLGITSIGGVGYLIAFIWISVWQTHKAQAPLVVHTHPPRFLQPFYCSRERGYSAGNSEGAAIKNIGNRTAFNVNPWVVDTLKFIPEEKHEPGDKRFEIPAEDCSARSIADKMSFPLSPGDERTPEFRQSAGTISAISALWPGEKVQLYEAECVAYSDEYGASHETCDTYRFNVPSNDPIDAISGTPVFLCDGRPVVGQFSEAIEGHCQQ